MTRAKKYVVTFKYELLKEELGIPLKELPRLFKRHLGKDIGLPAIQQWFYRKSMPLERLTELMFLARKHAKRKLDYWRYVELYDPYDVGDDDEPKAA